MARPWPPQKVPIERILEIAKRLRLLAEKIEASSQAIERTGVKEPWIHYLKSADDAVAALQRYAVGLYEQQSRLEMGDSGAPSIAIEPELTERGRKIVEEARAREKPKKPRKKRPQ